MIAEFVTTSEFLDAGVTSDVDELAAAAVAVINMTGTSASKTPPV